MNDAGIPAPVKRAGRFEATLQKLFTRRAHVVDIVDIGSAFRIVTLGGDALRHVAWTPGDKIQVQLGGWVQRTYTPIDWDPVAGRTRILVYLHADGPGTQWARMLNKGDDCILFGPRKSVGRPPSSAIVFGDETSLGLAAALSGPGMHLMVEVSAPDQVMPVLGYLGLNKAHLCARRDDDAHLTALEGQLSTWLMTDPAAEIVLTGRAAAIGHLTRFLRQTEVSTGRRQSKAYWAPGKKGLD
jgi:ferric-chelate reductase (NADPH)